MKNLTSILLAILLIVPTANSAGEISSEVFLGMSDAVCPIFEKNNNPDFETQISDHTYRALMASIGKPTIICVTPTKISRNSKTDLLINGQNTNFDISSNIIISDDIVVNKIDRLSNNQIIINITIPPQTSLGSYNLEVTSSNGEIAEGENVIQIVENSGNPEIISITPINFAKSSGQSTALIYGLNTNFAKNSIVDFHDDGIIAIPNIVYNSNFMEVFIVVHETARQGIHNITVTTDNEVAVNTQLGILRVVQEDSIQIVTPEETDDSQSEEIIDDDSQTEEKIDDDSQSEKIIDDDSQSEEIIDDDSQSEEIIKNDSQSEEIIEDNSQSEEIIDDDSQPEETTEDDSQSEETTKDDSQTEETTDDNTELEKTYELPSITVENTKSCPDSYEIHIYCTFQNKEVKDVYIAKNASVSDIILTGNMKNEGLASSITIQEGATFTGGNVSDHVENNGIMTDFTFVGASITGGILQGKIINNSNIYGYFENVYLAPNTTITGGQLRGDIFGVDPNNKPILQGLTIRKGSVLYNVKIGKDVIMDEDRVFIDESVEFIH